MAGNFAGAGVYLIQTFFGLFTFFIMIRFLMQVCRVDYYNPICQGIVKLTDPVIKPFSSFLPSIQNVNFATLTAAFLVQIIAVMLIMTLAGNTSFAPIYVAWVLLGLFAVIFDIFFFALIIRVIASFIAQGSSHPALDLVDQITEPVCAPARNLLPPMGGMDFSIILVFVSINIIDNFLIIAPIAQSIGVPRGIIMGL